MYFNILKIPFFDNDRMCHSYLYSITPYEIFQIKDMREKYIDLYNIIMPQRINRVSGFNNNYSKSCYYILCVPEPYKTNKMTQIAKNDDILYVYDYLSNNGYKIQSKDYRTTFEGYHISKHFGEIISTIYKS